MNSDAIKEIIQTLAGELGIASSEIVKHYSDWCVVSSLCCIIVGVIILFISGFFFYKGLKESEDRYSDEDETKIFLLIAAIFLFLVSCIVLCENIPDFYNPRSYAINKLINQIR